MTRLTNEKLKELIAKSILKADHVFDSPPKCLEVSGESENCIWGTLGNFSLIIASPKVGKTTTAAIPVAALLKKSNVLKFVPSLPENQSKIIWFDTEQGKPECVRTIRFISQIVTGDRRQHPDDLFFCSLRQFGYSTRLELIDYFITHSQNIGFIVIDGIRDLVSSINNEVEATKIADLLLKWSQEKNLHILTILHQNKGDANARGHLGSELINKAETVVRLTKNEDSGQRRTIVTSELSRHKEFNEFSFTINPGGDPEETEINKGGYDPKNPKAQELTHFEITEILQKIYQNGESYSFGKLQQKIYEICHTTEKSSGMFRSFGKNKCSDLIKILKEKRFITQKSGSDEYVNNTPF